MRLMPWLWAALLIFHAGPFGICFANEMLAIKKSIPARSERVLILVRDDCPQCEAELKKLRLPGGTFELLKAKGWEIGTTPDAHIQIADQEEFPDLAKGLTEADYPAILGVSGSEALRYFRSGCTTPLDAWTFGWLISGKNERPTEPVAESAQVASTGHYRLRGNHWSVEGDFNPSLEKTLTHLHGSNHATSAAAYGDISTWSLEELRSLHDDLHEREGGLSSGVGRGSSTSSRSGSSRPSYLTPKTLR